MSLLAIIRIPYVSSTSTFVSVIDPPLGPAYVAAALEAAGHRVELIDALGEAPDQRTPAAYPGLSALGLTIPEIVERIPAHAAGVGLSVMFSQSWPHAEALVRAIHGRYPEKPIFIGGEHATACWQYLLEHCPEITACVLGEGELTAVDLAAWLDGKRSLDSIPGIAIRREGQPVQTSPRPRVRELETLPWPAWHLVPLEAYFARRWGQGVDRGRSLPMLATRGCPFQCTFCSSPNMWTTRYVVRPVQDIVDEIETYVARYQVENIDFVDLTAFIKRDWILDLCQEMERRNVRVTFQLPVGTRSEVLDREVLQALYRSGCRNITYAPESGSQRTLDRIKKRVHLDRLLESIRAAHEIGMIVKVNIVIGFPFEERQDILETLLFNLELAKAGAEDILWFRFCPYPGTDLYRELLEEGVVPAMSNSYFASLGTTDLDGTLRPCRGIAPSELAAYATGGMLLSLMAGYAAHPHRVVRVMRNLARGVHESHVERRIARALRLPIAMAGSPQTGRLDETALPGVSRVRSMTQRESESRTSAFRRRASS
jgi:hypothetical protein